MALGGCDSWTMGGINTTADDPYRTFHMPWCAWNDWVIVVQSLTNLYGQGLAGDAKFIGGWFDRAPDAMLIVTSDEAFSAPVVMPGLPLDPTISTPAATLTMIGRVSVEALYPAAVAAVSMLYAVWFELTLRTSAATDP